MNTLRPGLNPFKINDLWRFYLEVNKINVNKIPTKQLAEMRKIFFGACGILLVVIRDEVAELEEEKAMVVFKNYMNQIKEFSLDVLKEFNDKNRSN